MKPCTKTSNAIPSKACCPAPAINALIPDWFKAEKVAEAALISWAAAVI